MDLLSETPRGYYYGRFNKWAAHTLLAKMYLNAEVWSVLLNGRNVLTSVIS